MGLNEIEAIVELQAEILAVRSPLHIGSVVLAVCVSAILVRGNFAFLESLE